MFSTGVILLVFIEASFHKCRKMPSRCVVFWCSNTPDLEQGIALQRLPYADDLRPVAVERRRHWIHFVKRKSAKWEPSNTSCVCSKHFNPNDFVSRVCLPGQEKTIPWLKKDDIGVIAYPSVCDEEDEELSGRAARAIRRKVRKYHAY